MRKIAPLVMTSLVAFAGAAIAQTAAVDTKTGSPTVSANTTNPTSQSYSDKSNTSPGTNAIVDEKAKMKAEKKAAKKKAALANDRTSTSLDTPSTSLDSSVSSSTTLAPSSTMPSTPSSSTAPIGNNDAANVNSTTGKSPQ